MDTTSTIFDPDDDPDDFLPSVDVFLTSDTTDPTTTTTTIPPLARTTPPPPPQQQLPSISQSIDIFDTPYPTPTPDFSLQQDPSTDTSSKPSSVSINPPFTDTTCSEAEITIDTTHTPTRTTYNTTLTAQPSLRPGSGEPPFLCEQRQSLAEAFRLTNESWAYQFVFGAQDRQVASLVMNPVAFEKSCYAEVDVHAMDVGPHRDGSGFIDFQHRFNWLLVPGFNRDDQVAGVLVSETVEDTNNISQGMPKRTIARFIRDNRTSEMLIFNYIGDSGNAKVIWIKNTRPFRQERKYFRLKYRQGEKPSQNPEEILFSVQCEERVRTCFKCRRISGECTCTMEMIMRPATNPVDFDAFQENMIVHDGAWHGCSVFFRKDKMGMCDTQNRLATLLDSKGFADPSKKNDMRIMVQQMWLNAMPIGMAVSSRPLLRWKEPPILSKEQERAWRKKVRNRVSAAKSNEKRRIRNLELRKGLAHVQKLKPMLQQRYQQLLQENQRLKMACFAKGLWPGQM